MKDQLISIEENFISNKELIDKFSGKDVIVFGAGEIGIKFLRQFEGILNVKCFVLSGNYADKPETIRGVPVYDLKNLGDIRVNEPIIIASAWHYKIMAEQLLNAGYEFGKDFFTWIPWAQKREQIHSFIEHNKIVWKNYISDNAPNKILIYRYLHNGAPLIDMSYFASYLARKHNAEIWTFGSKGRYYLRSLGRVYDSFNANHKFFTDDISVDQKRKAFKLLEQIWSTLNSKEDWLNLTVNGIDFGEEVCSWYMRKWENGNFGENGYEYKILRWENGMPLSDVHTDELKAYLLTILEEIVFWQDYFEQNKNIKAVILFDGIYKEGIVRKIAIANGVDVYAMLANWNIKMNYFSPGRQFRYYKQFFEELSDEDKTLGLKWAEKRLSARLKGDTSDVKYMDGHSPFVKGKEQTVLTPSDKIKVVICPHCMYDSPYGYGKFLFADHWDWLCFIGSMTLKTDYDWYLKIHPMAVKVDIDNINRLVEYYPKIKILPHDVSALQMRDEGMNFALTIWGTLGHEYPALGIQVINAGNNPHMAFDFTWNPKTRAEYEHLLMNLDKLHKKVDMQEIYKFYCIHFLYAFNPSLSSGKSVCYKSPELLRKLNVREELLDSERYIDFLAEWTPERHKEILHNVEERLALLDQYRDGVFMRDDEEIIRAKLESVGIFTGGGYDLTLTRFTRASPIYAVANYNIAA